MNVQKKLVGIRFMQKVRKQNSDIPLKNWDSIVRNCVTTGGVLRAIKIWRNKYPNVHEDPVGWRFPQRKLSMKSLRNRFVLVHYYDAHPERGLVLNSDERGVGVYIPKIADTYHADHDQIEPLDFWINEHCGLCDDPRNR